MMMMMTTITQRYDHMMKKSQHDACRYDEHWRPASVHCSPCNFPFTHIIHFESLQVDGLVDMLERILAKKPRCDSSNFSFPYLTAFYFFDTRLKRDFSWRSSAKRSLEAYQGCLNFFSLESSTWEFGKQARKCCRESTFQRGSSQQVWNIKTTVFVLSWLSCQPGQIKVNPRPKLMCSTDIFHFWMMTTSMGSTKYTSEQIAWII